MGQADEVNMMAAEPKRIKVDPGSELARLLEEAGPVPLLLEKNGELYYLKRTEREPADIWVGYDAHKVKNALKQSAGALAGVDRNRLLADIPVHSAARIVEAAASNECPTSLTRTG